MLSFFLLSVTLHCLLILHTTFSHYSFSKMAISITCSLSSTAIRATSASSKPDPDRKKPVWWYPLFGISVNPEYITTAGDTESDPVRPRPKITLGGGFTEEKAKELRRKTSESSTFHDVMYHSAIASRLASDLSDLSEK